MKKRVLLAIAACGLALAAAAETPQGVLTSANSWPTAGTISRADIEARYADAQSKFVVLDGVRVHYKDEGQGTPVLLLHGSFGDLGDWDGWASVLRTNHRVIRLDLPAFGLTGEVPSGNYSIDRYLTLVDALMDQLDLPQFAIVGTSYGGLVAFRYAATRVERVSALILLNSAGVEYGGRGGRTERPRDPSPRFTPRLMTTESMQKALLSVINDPSRVTPALVQRKTDLANIVGRDREAYVATQAYERGDPLRVLSHVRAPALVMWGGASKALSGETAQIFVGAMTHSVATQKIIYDGGGHLLHLERPQDTARDAAAFLDRVVVPTPKLASIPFWARSTGWWQSDNTYLDGAMNYNLRAYHSLVQVVVDGDTVRETEYKFYPPGKMAAGYAQGKGTAEEGTEVVTTFIGKQIDAQGSVRLVSVLPKPPTDEATVISVLSPDTAVRTTRDPAHGVDNYRMYFSMPTADKRYVTNFGIHSAPSDASGAQGDLRGFSVFRGSRFDAAEFERRRAELRARNSVHVLVTADASGKVLVTRLD